MGEVWEPPRNRATRATGRNLSVAAVGTMASAARQPDAGAPGQGATAPSTGQPVHGQTSR